MAGARNEQTSPVGVDHSTLKGEVSGTDTRYSVGLIGQLDAPWAQTFQRLQADSSAIQRFRLDVSKRTISFTCREIEGPARVFEVLVRLDVLIKRVNEQVFGRR
jgi:hypothetical protein